MHKHLIQEMNQVIHYPCSAAEQYPDFHLM